MPTVRGPFKQVKGSSDKILQLVNDKGIFVQVEILRDAVAHVRIDASEASASSGRTWMIVNEAGEVDFDGNNKSSITKPRLASDGSWSRFDSQTFKYTSSNIIVCVWTEGDLRVECSHHKFGVFFADASFDAYQTEADGTDSFRHVVQSDLTKEKYYGFGETCGLMNKAGMRLRVDARDSMGYDAESSDPLYKHWPYHLTVKNDGCCYGLLYDTMRRSLFDLGRFDIRASNAVKQLTLKMKARRLAHFEVDIDTLRHGSGRKDWITMYCLEIHRRTYPRRSLVSLEPVRFLQSGHWAISGAAWRTPNRRMLWNA